MNTPIDLNGIPAPNILDPLDFQAARAKVLAVWQEKHPDYVDRPADPVSKILDVVAYQKVLLDAKINAKCKGVMVAYAQGTDLDNLAALIPLERHLLEPADPDADPPKEAVYESDNDFRRRVQLAPEGFSNAGSEGAYIYHALGVVGVRDAQPVSPAPVRVDLYILSNDESQGGLPSEELLDQVRAKFSADVRPLTDLLTVYPAEIVEYTVEAAIHLRPDPSSTPIYEAALARLKNYVQECNRLGAEVARSGIYSALHIEGVQRVDVISPANDVFMLRDGEEGDLEYLQYTRAPYCKSINVTKVGV